MLSKSINRASALGAPAVRTLKGRNLAAVRNYWGRHSLVPWSVTATSPRNIFEDIERQLAEVERAFYEPWGPGANNWRPFIDLEHPTATELFRLRNPIVEVDGVKQFKLEFDVRRFEPNEVKITTNAKDSSLTVEAKHKDDNSKFEYLRKVSVPEGVELSKISCKHRSDGVLILEAPYVEPKIEPPKETVIEIEHK